MFQFITIDNALVGNSDMKSLYSLCILSTMITVIYTAHAAEWKPWSLSQCIRHALEHNIRIKGQRLDTTFYKHRYRQSKADLMPNINGHANQNFQFGRTIDPYTYEYQENNVQSNTFSLTGQVTLFDGFRTIRSIRRNQIDLNASVKEVEHLKNQITAQVVDAYLMVLYNKEIIVATIRQIEVTRRQIERTEVLVKAGSVSKGNLFELSALVAQEEVDLLKARNQENISLLILKQLLDLDTIVHFAIAPLQLPEIHDTDLQVTLPDLYRDALLQPEVTSGELAIQSASLDLKIEKGKHLPSLTFDATMGTGYSEAYKKYRQTAGEPTQIGYLGIDQQEAVYAPSTVTQTVDYPFSDQIKDNINTTLSLKLTIPLFNRMQTANAITNAKIAIEKKQLAYENIKKEVLLNVQTAYNDARTALHEYYGNIRVYESTRESFRYTEEKFNVEMVSSIDYHNGKNLLSKAESNLLQSKYKYFLKKSILEILCGKPVSIN